MKIEIISLFTGLLLVGHINIGMRVRNLFKIDESKPMKLLTCLPCVCFWIAIALSVGIIWYKHGVSMSPQQLIQEFDVYKPMAVFIIAHLLQNR